MRAAGRRNAAAAEPAGGKDIRGGGSRARPDGKSTSHIQIQPPAEAAGKAVHPGRHHQRGLHHHAVLLVPVNTRLDHGVDVEVAENKAVYLGRHGKLRHIDVQPIGKPEGDVVGYALKQVARNPTSVDDVLVLPKAPSELIPRAELRRG